MVGKSDLDASSPLVHFSESPIFNCALSRVGWEEGKDDELEGMEYMAVYGKKMCSPFSQLQVARFWSPFALLELSKWI